MKHNLSNNFQKAQTPDVLILIDNSGSMKSHNGDKPSLQERTVEAAERVAIDAKTNNPDLKISVSLLEKVLSPYYVGYANSSSYSDIKTASAKMMGPIGNAMSLAKGLEILEENISSTRSPTPSKIIIVTDRTSVSSKALTVSPLASIVNRSTSNVSLLEVQDQTEQDTTKPQPKSGIEDVVKACKNLLPEKIGAKLNYITKDADQLEAALRELVLGDNQAPQPKPSADNSPRPTK